MIGFGFNINGFDSMIRIIAKAETKAYIVLSGVWFFFGISGLLLLLFKPIDNPLEFFFNCIFFLLIGGLWIVCIKGLRLEIDDVFFIYRNWFYQEKKFELRKISKMQEGWFEIKRKIGRNTDVNGIKIKYNGEFVIINTKPFGGENYREIIAALKKTAENSKNSKKQS